MPMLNLGSLGYIFLGRVEAAIKITSLESRKILTYFFFSFFLGGGGLVEGTLGPSIDCLAKEKKIRKIRHQGLPKKLFEPPPPTKKSH